MWIATVIWACVAASPGVVAVHDDPPPGIDVAAISRRAPEDPLAFTALVDVSTPRSLPPVGAPAGERSPLLRTPEETAAAERALVLGLEAVALQRWFVASIELERARSLGTTAPDLPRGLARTHRALGNASRAADEWRRVLASSPDDAEALLEVGIALVDRREPELALDPLLRVWRQVADPASDTAVAVAQALGDAVRPVVAYALASALWQTGRDRAGIEAALCSLEAPPPAPQQFVAAERARVDPPPARLAEIARQRGSLWQSIGDARCRLGDFDGALDSYRRASECGIARPVLEGRILHAQRQRDGIDAVASAWLARLGLDPASADEASAAHARWLANGLEDPSPFVARMRELAAEKPMRADLLRAAAAVLPPDESATLLLTVAERRPFDDVLVGELLRSAAAAGDSSIQHAARHAIELVRSAPQRARTVAAQLVTVNATPGGLRTALESCEPSSARDALLVHILLGWGDSQAWREAEAAVARYPGAADAVAAQLAVAGALAEPALIDQIERQWNGASTAAVGEATPSVADKHLVQAALIEARVQSRQGDRAMLVAEAGLGADAPSWFLGVCADAAAAWASAAPVGAEGRDHRVLQAIDWAERAVAAAPANESPWRTLLTIHDPQGTLAPDAQAIEELSRRIGTMRALESLNARLAVQRDASRRRLAPAAERLAALAEQDPADAALVSMLVDAWQRLGRAEEAEAWLRAAVERMPSNPAVVRLAASALARTGRTDEAKQWLSGRVEADPDDALARGLLESALRESADDVDGADRQRWAMLARKRVSARPAAPGRSLELARVELFGGDMDAALAALEEIATDVRTSPDQLRGGLAALTAAMRDPADRTRAADELIVRLADRVLEADLAGDFAVRAARLVATARLGHPQAAIQAAIDAMVKSPDGLDSSPETAGDLILLAQSLLDAERADVAVDLLWASLRGESRPERVAFAQLANAASTALVAIRRPERAIEFVLEMMERRGDTGWPSQEIIMANGMVRDVSNVDAVAIFVQSSRWSLLGEHEGAEALLRAALERDPDHTMAKNNLGWLLLERDGPTPEATSLIESAAATSPLAASVVDSLGWLRYHQDRLEDHGDDLGAVSLLRRAVELSGADLTADVLDHFGDALWKQGRHDDAAAQWRRAVRHVDERSPRAAMLSALLNHQQRELGLVIRDPRELYEDTYWSVRERARRKVEAFDAGLEPAVGAR